MFKVHYKDKTGMLETFVVVSSGPRLFTDTETKLARDFASSGIQDIGTNFGEVC